MVKAAALGYLLSHPAVHFKISFKTFLVDKHKTLYALAEGVLINIYRVFHVYHTFNGIFFKYLSYGMVQFVNLRIV